jgi:hypothetical protein
MKPRVKRGAKYSCLAVAGTATVFGDLTAGSRCDVTARFACYISPPIHWRVTHCGVTYCNFIQQRIYLSGLQSVINSIVIPTRTGIYFSHELRDTGDPCSLLPQGQFSQEQANDELAGPFDGIMKVER